VGYVYGLIRYLSAADWQNAWARAGTPTSVQRSTESTLRQTLETTLGGYEPPQSDLGGWSLSSHHRYDPAGRTLHLGDGSHRTAHNIGLLAERAVGDMTGAGDSTGDGGPAREATLGFPEEVAVGPDGSLYLTDSNNARIRKVDPDGTIETVAGTGEFRDYGDPAGDGGPATAAELDYAYGIDIGPDGSIYFSDWNRIRKIDPTGVITTVAGHEVDGSDPDFSGDDGPATEANLNFADAVAIAPDGSFYFVDYGNHRVRHVGTDGIVTTVAGTGMSGYSGDGGPAADAKLSTPEDIDIGPDGSVYIADTGNARVRRVGPDGVIDTVAGDGQLGHPTWGVTATDTAVPPRGIAIDEQGGLLVTIDDTLTVGRVGSDGVLQKLAGVECSGPDCVFDSSDGTLAAGADIGCPWGIATGHSRDVYVTEMCGHTIRRLRQALPGFDDSDIAIPSSDGSEVFKFDATGRHLETRDALTGAVRSEFSYDAGGRLAAIEDGDGLVTTVDRDAEGKPTAIVAPFGSETALTQGPGGYLASLTNPAGEQTVFGYGNGGLLISLLEPGGGETTFAYDSWGRLVKDTDAAGGFKELSRVPAEDRVEATLETKLGRASTYEIEWLTDGDTRRTKTDAAGFETTLLRGHDGTDKLDRPDGTFQESTMAGDPRFGMRSAFGRSRATQIPGGPRLEIETDRDATLSDPENPLSLTQLVESVEVNGRSSTTVFDSALSRFTVTSPEGRAATTTVDSQRRPVEAAVGGITPVIFGRDSVGRVDEIVQGSRASSFSYDAQGRLATATDALGGVRGFQYDAADRVVKEVLPDLREVEFAYDDDGNLVSVTPSSRPAHAFAHTPVALTQSYTPPELGSGPQPTLFDWNDDRDLVKVTKPGGRELDFGYDSAGRLETVAHGRGTTHLFYDALTGNPASATAPGGEQIAFDFDGFLPTGETISGTVAGQVARTFDDDFRVVSESVNGAHTVGFGYDDDGLLTAAGGLSLGRDAQNGLIAAATVGQVATAVDRDSFGDPETVSSSHGATTIYEETYARDDLGRIVEKVERRGTQATIYEYGYDAGGRLQTVSEDGVLAATYSYDANGNRTGVDRAGELPVVAQYDAQDRLTAHGSVTYGYDASGQLQSKTDGGQATSYVYDDLGALMKATLPDATEISYAVDASGRRIAKRRDGQLEQGLLYGQGIAPLAELNPDGSVKSRFVYATGSNVPDYMVQGAATYRILVDQLGSPRAVVDAASGAVVQEMDFDEFGRVIRDTNPGFQPFGFAGGLYDADTGLVRFGARDYDPDTGRFTAKDPIGFAGGDTNLYGYVLSDPINWIDPSGLFLTEVGGAIDAVTPDFVSNAAAGVIDGTTFGGASAAFDIDAWCGASGYGLGTFLAPGPAKFLKGFSVLGINKTVRVDRSGKPIPDSQRLNPTIGDRSQSQAKAEEFIEKLTHKDGSSTSQNNRAILDGARTVFDKFQDLGF
jgi:RHS repeat-associated protein